MVEIETLFQTRTATKNIPFGAVREYPPPPHNSGEKRVADYESRWLHKRD